MDFEEHVKTQLNDIKSLCKKNHDGHVTNAANIHDNTVEIGKVKSRTGNMEGKISVFSTFFGMVGAAIAEYLKKTLGG